MVTWRVSRYLYLRIKDQLDGKVDLLTTLQYEWQYEDLFKDSEDMRIVNYRYSIYIVHIY